MGVNERFIMWYKKTIASPIAIMIPLILATAAKAAIEPQTMEGLQAVVVFIKELGFPVAVSIYCLWVIRVTIGENTKALEALSSSITRMETFVETLAKK